VRWYSGHRGLAADPGEPLSKLVFVGDAARELPSSIWADRIVHAEGVDGLLAVLRGGEDPLLPLLSLPFQWAFPHPGWWLPFVLVGLVLNGWAAAGLARILGRGRGSQWLCGVAFALTPATLRALDAGRQGLVWTAAVPLAWTWAHRAWRGGRDRDAWVAGLFLALCGLGHPGLGVAAWVGVFGLRRGEVLQPQFGRMFRIWLLSAPFALPALADVWAGNGTLGAVLWSWADGLAVVVGLGLALALSSRPRAGWAVALALPLWVGLPTISTVQTPPVHGLLPADGGGWVELPIAATVGHRIFQADHGHPILEGPWLDAAVPQVWPAEAGLPVALAEAAAAGLTHVIVHTSLFRAEGVDTAREEQRLAWLDATLGPPVVVTHEARAYRLRSPQRSSTTPSSPQSM